MAKRSADSARFEDSRDYVQSMARGLAVLTAFDRDHVRLTLGEIASRANLSRAAARRLILTLQHLGYVREAGRSYVLGPRVLELGFGYLGSLNLTDLAQPLMEDLARQVRQSSSMAVLDGQSIVYVLRVPGQRVMSVTLGVGARLPAFCAAMGRVLLSGLTPAEFDTWLGACEPRRLTPHTVTEPERLRRIVDDVRNQGYAYVEQELELGLCSIAVPIRNAEGRVATAINVSMPYQPDVARHALGTILPPLQQTAAAIESCLPTGRLVPVTA
ncbi:IclR family transcriptional regulator C-terminal domain-containing protein [Lysobacter yangpyeongensis]|uniref:IclR family transcriptional regulator C-terminal domain-containing protein n=1 Tax=Lysobacter yangpyeongensis TaxID=346182 RepID=A0ABW0SMK7_9GAMM